MRPNLHLEEDEDNSVSMPVAWYSMEKEERVAFCVF